MNPSLYQDALSASLEMSKGEHINCPAPMPAAPETWANIERELAAHDAGEKGFTLAEMRGFARF
jgi:hypothetical protein